jgi:hypothetical protein
VTKAIIGACLQVTLTTSEAWVASAGSVVAVFVVSATSLTTLQRAISSHEPTVAHTGPVNTLSVACALIGACAN